VGRGFEVAEEVDEEVVWVGGACVFILGGIWLISMRLDAFVVLVLGVAVRENYDFVDTEDGESAGDVAAKRGS
jgi:hypothetical protein